MWPFRQLGVFVVGVTPYMALYLAFALAVHPYVGLVIAFTAMGVDYHVGNPVEETLTKYGLLPEPEGSS